MKKKQIVVEPELFTLGDMLGGASRVTGDIEILNECNETLLILWDTEDYVCPLTKTLDNNLLSRAVLRYGVRDGRTIFVLSGVEDAE